MAWWSVEDPAIRGGTGLSMLKSKTTAPRAVVEPLPIWSTSLPVRGPIIIPTMQERYVNVMTSVGVLKLK